MAEDRDNSVGAGLAENLFTLKTISGQNPPRQTQNYFIRV